MPSASSSSSAVTVQRPVEETVALPNCVAALSIIFTVAYGSPEPEKVGSLSEVRSSSVSSPVSDPTVKSGSEGGSISISMVIDKESDLGPEIPISLTAVAYIMCSPSLSPLTSIVQVPS